MKELRTLLFQRALFNYHAVMYFKKEIIISFFIITVSASDFYMPMIWLYLFLLDFLILFLCDPDLQWGVAVFRMPVYGPPESGSLIICTDPDPSINKKKKLRKNLISEVVLLSTECCHLM